MPLASLITLLVLGAPTPTAPQEVHVGVYMHHIPEIDLKSSTYLADFYMWFRWRGDRDPTKTFEFTNVADASTLLRTPIYLDDAGNPAPQTLEDGAHYQQFHVQGRFTHPFSVQRYPFDEQDVVVEFEDTRALTDEMVYRVDTIGRSGVHPGLALAGWELDDVKLEVTDARYATNFGDPRVSANAEAFTHVAAKLHIRRPIWSSLVKSIVPLLIVLLITLVVFLIDNRYFEARLGLGITTLISAVALQLTSNNELPTVGYVVLLDKIYNISYAIIFVALLESVVAVRLTDGGKPERANRLDIVSLVLCLVLALGGGVWLTLSQ